MPSEGKKGTGSSAIFVARNRLAALDKSAQVSHHEPSPPSESAHTHHTQSIEIRDLSNNLTKSVKCPVQTTDIFYGGTASLLLATTNSVVLFDIQQQKTLAEITTPAVKYVVWSADGNMVALLSKHSEPSSSRREKGGYGGRADDVAITIANKSLGQSALIHETIRIKSAAWDDSGILVYTTLNHIKYALPQG